MDPRVKQEMIVLVAGLIRLYPTMALKTPEQPTRIIQPMTTLPGYPSAEDVKAFMADLPFIDSITVFDWLDQTGETPEVVPGLKIECRSAVDMGMWP